MGTIHIEIEKVNILLGWWLTVFLPNLTWNHRHIENNIITTTNTNGNTNGNTNKTENVHHQFHSSMKKVQLFPQHLITSELRLNYLFCHTPYTIPTHCMSKSIVCITIISEGMRTGKWRRRWFYCLLLSLDSLSFQISFTLLVFLLFHSLATCHTQTANSSYFDRIKIEKKMGRQMKNTVTMISFRRCSSRVTVTTVTVAPLSKQIVGTNECIEKV